MGRGIYTCRFLVLALVLPAWSLSALAQTSALWSGSAQCTLTMQSDGYAHREVQTWTISPGSQPLPGAMPAYPATWTVTGGGGSQRMQGAQILAARWTSAVPAMSAPIAIFVRASDRRLIIKAWHSQLTAPGAISTVRQIGGAQSNLALTATEWPFPAIEADESSTDVRGTGTVLVPGSLMPMQLASASGTANCSWQFTKGATATMLAHQPNATGPTLISQAPNGTVANTQMTNSAPSALAPTQIAKAPAAYPNGSQVQTQASSNSVPANAGPTAYAAPNGDTSTTVAANARPAVSPVPSAVANAPATNPLSTDGASGKPSATVPSSVSAIPMLPAPTEFTAKNMGDGLVQLQWQTVSGATQYRLDGTGIPSTGLFVSPDVNGGGPVATLAASQAPKGPAHTSTTIQKVPLGPGTWHVASVDARKTWSAKQTATATAVVRYVPAHAGQWLTKNNGVGSASKAAAQYLSFCPMCVPGASFSDVLTALGVSSNALADGNNSADDCFNGGQTPTSCTWTDIHAARYRNVTEFGTTRITRCWEALPGNNGPRTVCYSKSGDHGLTVIVKESDHAWFLTFAWNDNAGTALPNAAKEVVNWFGFQTLGIPMQSNYILTTQVIIDSEGPKYPPNACLSCHGGTFNGSWVTGATLLPLDTGLLQVDDRSDTMAKNFINVNQAVMLHGPSPAVMRYLNGLYGGAPRPESGWGDLDYVPQGWKQQSDFYKTAVRPYCMMCHLATPSNLDFSTFGNFAQNKDLINAEVCSGHTMPHAEYPFKQFWTKDTGQVFLPGYLAAAVGITNCP